MKYLALKNWRALLGIEPSATSHRERLISALGASISIMIVYAVTDALLGPGNIVLMAAPIGATALLLFAAPHSALSQPWPVMGGYAISTALGVCCALLVPNQAVASGLAVGLAVAAMYYLRCLHPPGGAMALLAVIGGEQVHRLGFHFVLVPAMANVAIILLVAIAFNALLPWRRYPAVFARRTPQPLPLAGGYEAISHEDFVYALTQVESFIDVSEDDLLRIYALATGRHPPRT